MIVLSIVLYKTAREHLFHVLQSCSSAKRILSAVCIVDNSPTDELRTIVESHGYVYMHRPDNPGFGTSHNFAFANVGMDSKYYFVINADVKFRESDLAALVGYLEGNDDVGLVAPRVILPSGEIQYNRTLLPTPMNLILRRFFPRSALGEKLNTQFELRFMCGDETMAIPALTGCFMLIRSSIFRELGGFDENFFLYLEDYDLTRRIGRKAKTVYYPRAIITHEHARGSYKSNRLLLAYAISAIRYFSKWGWLLDRERSAINTRTLRDVNGAR